MALRTPRTPASAYNGHKSVTCRRAIEASPTASRVRPAPHKRSTRAGENLSLTHPPKGMSNAPGTAATASTEPSAKPGPAIRSASRVRATRSIWSANAAMLSPKKSRRNAGVRMGRNMIVLWTDFGIRPPRN
jgi:hypothetical protein